MLTAEHIESETSCKHNIESCLIGYRYTYRNKERQLIADS